VATAGLHHSDKILRILDYQCTYLLVKEEEEGGVTKYHCGETTVSEVSRTYCWSCKFCCLREKSIPLPRK